MERDATETELMEIADLLQVTSVLDRLTVEICFKLIDLGVDPLEIGRRILEIRREVGH